MPTIKASEIIAPNSYKLHVTSFLLAQNAETQQDHSGKERQGTHGLSSRRLFPGKSAELEIPATNKVGKLCSSGPIICICANHKAKG